MAVYREEKTNTWRVIYRYTDWTGERKQSQKRGFKTKREAQAWEREQLNKIQHPPLSDIWHIGARRSDAAPVLPVLQTSDRRDF